MKINKNSTRSVSPILAKIRSIESDGRGNLVVQLEQIDHQTGLSINSPLTFSVNLFGLNDENRSNFSVGAAFGAVLNDFSDSDDNFDLLTLENHLVVGFIHYNYSQKTNTWYENLYDVYPVSWLQCPFLNQNNGGNE